MNAFPISPRRILSLRARLLAGLLLAALGVGLARAETRSQRMIAPGVSHLVVQRAEGPLAINVIELDPKQQYISLASTPGGPAGRLRVSELAAAHAAPERYPVAAINGDYFVMGGVADGALLGLNISGGNLVSAGGERSALVVLEDGTAQVASLRLDAWLETPQGKRMTIAALNQPRGRAVALYTPAYGTSTRTPASGREVVLDGVPEPLALGQTYEAKVTASTHAVGNLALWPGQVAVSAATQAAGPLATLAVGDTVKLRVDLAPRPAGRVIEAVGGGPRLLRGGRVSVETSREQFQSNHAERRHPRTAAGVKADGRVVLAVVDGRQACSRGMTLHELAQLMLDLGCRDAVNLDGGGSTAMWVRGSIVNSPCDGRERAVGNALLVMSSAPHGPPTQVRLTPESIVALPGYRTVIEVEAQDEYYNPVGFSTTGIGWACESAIGTVSPRGEFTAAEVTETTTGSIRIYLAGATAKVPVTVYARPPALRISPAVVTAAPGQRIRFALAALDEGERPLPFDAKQVRWSAEEAAGNIGGDGLLVAGPGPGGRVTATLFGAEASARVVFASTTVMVEGFEAEGEWEALSWPREVPVTCERVAHPVREGEYALRLAYDFTTTTEARAAYLRVGAEVGAAIALRAWVYGDGQGHWLRARITDAAGETFTLDFAPRVDWSGWREVIAHVPPEAQAPIKWDTIYLSQFRPESQSAGELVFDALRVEVVASPDADLEAGGSPPL